ncbi:MAG TPA: hypothetical protein VNW92_12945, partial [Polyangiaceae bacterium]|nr:hypothetical protein [Polyangiaceae bacterium]
ACVKTILANEGFDQLFVIDQRDGALRGSAAASLRAGSYAARRGSRFRAGGPPQQLERGGIRSMISMASSRSSVSW